MIPLVTAALRSCLLVCTSVCSGVAQQLFLTWAGPSKQANSMTNFICGIEQQQYLPVEHFSFSGCLRQAACHLLLCIVALLLEVLPTPELQHRQQRCGWCPDNRSREVLRWAQQDAEQCPGSAALAAVYWDRATLPAGTLQSGRRRHARSLEDTW